jgi:5-methylcytosine-specific restriction endonuclease McrA
MAAVKELSITGQEEAKLATILSSIVDSLTDPQKIMDSFGRLENLEGLRDYISEFDPDSGFRVNKQAIKRIIERVKRDLKPSDLISTVFHEAGHAVVANLCGFGVHGLRISTGWQPSESLDVLFELTAGATSTDLYDAKTENWINDCIKERAYFRIKALLEDYMMVLAAGQFHENAFLHIPFTPQSLEVAGDRKHAAELLEVYLNAYNKIMGTQELFSKENKELMLDTFWNRALRRLALLIIPYKSRELLMDVVKDLGEKLLLGTDRLTELFAIHNRKNGGRIAYRPHIDTASYYYSPEWKELSNRVKERDGFKCQTCGRAGPQLNVHHIHYDSADAENPGSENAEDLITLCQSCHVLFHAMLKGSISPSDLEQIHFKAYLQAGPIPQFDFCHHTAGTAEEVYVKFYIAHGASADLWLDQRTMFRRTFQMNLMRLLGLRVAQVPEFDALWIALGDKSFSFETTDIERLEKIISKLRAESKTDEEIKRLIKEVFQSYVDERQATSPDSQERAG